ncbi:MAG: hypothetical protein JSS11_00530 [Verrucomicrobia bacterium]|nr:hypothetical protein [Verrucomicrobiota bacterium]
MTTPATPSSSKAAAAPTDVQAVLNSEDSFNQFWAKYRTLLLGGLAVIVLAIAVKGGIEYFAAQKEDGIRQAFAAANTPEKLKAFAVANPEHSLAGVALLQLADQAYAAGKAADASQGYWDAAKILKTGSLASRAKLGGAMALILAGKTSDGEAALKQLLSDDTQPKLIRAEAGAHLATLAAAAKNADEAKRYADQVEQLDGAGVWSRQMLMLRASLPVTAEPAVTIPAKK